jgi:hypothetical protein
MSRFDGDMQPVVISFFLDQKTRVLLHVSIQFPLLGGIIIYITAGQIEQREEQNKGLSQSWLY